MADNCVVKKKSLNELQKRQPKRDSALYYFATMVNNPRFSDITFIVGEGENQQRIYAHKLVLCVRSDVFDVMFNGPLAVKSQEVKISDIQPDVFLVFLNHVYCDKTEVDGRNVLSVFYAAKKYDVPSLVKHCRNFLKRSLCMENVFDLLTAARYFGLPHLSSCCLQLIDENAKEALAMKSFLKIDLDCLCLVLERDTLDVDENDLFKAICLWSTAQCVLRGLPVTSQNQKIVLDNALKLIRFPLMTAEVFASGPVESGILTPEEVVEVFQCLTIDSKPSAAFKNTPRIKSEKSESKIPPRFRKFKFRNQFYD